MMRIIYIPKTKKTLHTRNIIKELMKNLLPDKLLLLIESETYSRETFQEKMPNVIMKS